MTFRYPDGQENILEHFNLKVPQGTNVAIVGETGAGKSTLVNLVCRFFEPTEGQVLIDGRDARERSQLWLHSNIGYVLQTPHLFSGSVLENLRYGNEHATMEQIEAAVRAVSADEIIARLPEGYESDVGEGGNSLSTGEKQLLSFARALLADPRIFVLDEATSSVDTVTERAHPERHRKGDGGADIVHHRAPAVDHPAGGRDPRRPRRQDRGERLAPRTDGGEGRLLAALHAAVPRRTDAQHHGNVM